MGWIVALNPDFGQVEVDQAVLNLTVFETYYHGENALFFLKGHRYFHLVILLISPDALFYSRRIGKKPSSSFNLLDSGYTFVESPQTTRILGAGKFSGKNR